MLGGSMFNKLSKILELHLLKVTKELEILNNSYNDTERIKLYNAETGKRFNNIIDRYAISEKELLSISETVARFVTYTRRTNIDKYLFVDDEMQIPRIIK
jgi:hypothetical protein